MRIPCVVLSVCASKFLYLLSKDSHWETEKAGYKNAGISAYMVRVTRPALMLSRRCFSKHRDNSFSFLLKCDASQKNAAVVIFQRKIAAVFLFTARKSVRNGKENERI